MYVYFAHVLHFKRFSRNTVFCFGISVGRTEKCTLIARTFAISSTNAEGP